MSRLTIFADDATDAALLCTDDAKRIAAELATIVVQFERRDSPVAIGENDAAERILDAYRPHPDRLMGASGAGSADVIRIGPDAPNYDVLRQKLLPKHTYTEEEVRFLVGDGGSSVRHVDGRVFDAHCTRGDLISVPATIQHRFDAVPTPEFNAVRIFIDIAGWTPHDTGGAISERFPVE